MTPEIGRADTKKPFICSFVAVDYNKIDKYHYKVANRKRKNKL